MSERAKKIFLMGIAKHNNSISSSEDEHLLDSDNTDEDGNWLPSDEGGSGISDQSSEISENLHTSGEISIIETNNLNTTNESDNDEWVDTDITTLPFATTCSTSSTISQQAIGQTPLQFFNLFITDNLWEIMVIETNKYANLLKSAHEKPNSRITKWRDTNKTELQKFFSILITTGLVNVPVIQLYWSKDTMYHNEFISSIMPRDRFLLLLRCWHFTSEDGNSNDRLYKLRPIIEILLNNFKNRLTPGQDVVIDESMIPWRGRLAFKQYITNKRHKFGVKLYKLCTIDGYVYNFKIYSGKGDTAQGESHTLSIVKYLMGDLLGQGRTLYVDNFYNGIDVANYLLSNQTKVCGTLRSNRKGLPRLVVSKKLRRGEIIGKMKNNIKVIKWMDKRPVLMLTTKDQHSTDLLATGKTNKAGPVLKPQCVIEYNNAKKGVDYSDQMSNYYTVLKKGLKWYRKVAMELIFGCALINAWIIYCQKVEKIPVKVFKEQLARELLSENAPQEENTTRQRPPKRVHTLQTEVSKKRRKCTGCYSQLRKTMTSKQADNKTKKVPTYCDECEGKPALCLSCFNQRHEKV
jgi:hypothetical protein